MGDNTERDRRRRKGQTLAEFAITLPIVLLLMFGIIEFGRIFQAWVTLQNAARTAARYASTGQFYDRYQMDFSKLDDPDSLIPCVRDESFGGDQRGTQDTYKPSADSYSVKVYRGGRESLFATWNDGRNCDPALEAHQDMRKDMVRLLSIMEEARRGASGLMLEENSLDLPNDPTVVAGQPWYEVWRRPYPRSSERGWFHVMICSTRPMLDSANGSTSSLKLATGTSSATVTTRFVTYLGDSVLRDMTDADLNPQPIAPACVLNEKLPANYVTDFKMLDNAGIPWMDPGGPGDSVTVIVTFNHPLITPLGLAPYIQMQARRTAIVESFRAARAVGAINNPGADNPAFDTLEPTDTNTPEPTLTPSATFTGTPLPTNTLTNTPRPPFECSRVKADTLVINGNQVSIQITNDNDLATVLTRVIFRWRPITIFPNMYVSDMGVNGIPVWRGRDNTPPTDTNADKSEPPFPDFPLTDESDRTVGANDAVTWGALFSEPMRLQDYTTMHDYAGTQFYLLNPTNGTNCVITLDLPTPTPVPTRDPAQPTNTPTRTPDCASNELRVRFVRFEQFGLVRLEVVNNRTAVAPFTDFTIRWRQVAAGVLTLARVSVVAPQGSPGSVTVWDSNSATEDKTPPTTGRAEGRWIQNYTFSPNSITPLYIDFDGISSRVDSVGMSPVDFNGSEFIIGCGNPGGGGGGGTTPSGKIILDQVPTPRPTNTPGPSRTPAPTFTPSKTPTKGPPTAVPTAGPTKPPPTQPPATNTPRPPTNTPIPTLSDGGKSD
ncbi:MAG: pilus assembly protein [Chloroflexi bacterium]|nr:pilus assembly protein [Chloroflexota bacterium]